MDILESLIMYFCIAFALILVYMLTNNETRLSDEIHENYADFREKNLVGDDYE